MTCVFIKGLFWRRPVLTAVLTVMLLSLAGIPLTAGFVTKFTIFFAAVQGMHFLAAGMIILGSAIGLYYYLRILVNLYQNPKSILSLMHINIGALRQAEVMAMIITALIVIFGVLPEAMMQMAARAVML